MQNNVKCYLYNDLSYEKVCVFSLFLRYNQCPDYNRSLCVYTFLICINLKAHADIEPF